jgi:hypothetical protein
MKLISFSGRFLATLVLLGSLGTTASGQYLGGGGGSTPEGDYLRGVGFAAMGMGIYNEKTAIAESINVDTAIRWNEYVAAVAKQQSMEYASRRLRIAEENKEKYNKILERIKNAPSARDVLDGDALTAELDKLTAPDISESSFRYAEVPLSIDDIRRIPFRLGERGETFSMRRLTMKGKGKWPVAFQDPAFAAERRAFDEAVKKALDEAMEGNAQLATIRGVQEAAEGLARKLDQVVDAKDDQRAYSEAVERLKELKSTARLLETHTIQLAIAEIDKYSGTTVNDLKVFMRNYKLTFGAAASKEERALYPQLYEALKIQREKLSGAASTPAK